jgi:diacylglycerol O-acyltransferase / wax synthase
MSTRERISHVDTAWLRMDRPTNLMQIVGVMIFNGRLDFPRFRRTVEARLLSTQGFRRFRQNAVIEGNSAWWVDDRNFDIDEHLKHGLLPFPGGTAELQHFVAELAGTPLNPHRPLWEFNVVEMENGDSALVARIHHAIADGIALIGVMHSLTDTHADAPSGNSSLPLSPNVNDPACAEEADSLGDLFWRWIYQPLSDTTLAAIRLSGNIWVKYVGLMLDPDKAAKYARLGTGIAIEVGKLAMMPNDSTTRFKGKPGTRKCVAWSEPISLPQVKAVGKVLGCSVNDMLLASAAGALRHYLAEKGDAVDDVEVRALVPVNLRRAKDTDELGNRFGLVALELPVGVENPLARLYETRRRMETLKGSLQAMLTLSILGAVGMAPKFVQQQILDLLANKATAVMTNVPGPQQPRWFAGSQLKQQMFWVPQSGNIGMGVSILSYDNKVQFGLMTDSSRVPDPERIVARFSSEFEKLLWLVLMEPWDRLNDPDAVEAALAPNKSGH